MQEGDSDRLSFTLEDALQTLRAHLPDIYRHYNAKSLGIFGSFVRGGTGRKKRPGYPGGIYIGSHILPVCQNGGLSRSAPGS